MTRPTPRNEWIQRARDWGVRPARSKGQNFLLDHDVVDRIVDAATVTPGDRILEIGPGLGILTDALLQRGAQLTAVELDDTLAAKLAQHFLCTSALRLVHDDASRLDPATLFAPGEIYTVVANLPYSVATVIVRHLLESARPPEVLIVMVQKEVAERMTAITGNLSLLTIATRFYSEPEYLFTVPTGAFYPQPKVQSAVVRLYVRQHALTTDSVRDRLFRLATIAFQQKRKTILNSLSTGLSLDKQLLANRMEKAGLDAGKRPQALSFEEWLMLARILVDE